MNIRREGKMKNWVDFKTIKKRVRMENVLIHYGLIGELKQAGNNLVGCCPIHQGNNPRQFSVNLERNIFNCFGNCKSGGNVLDFVAKMEDISIREAALLLQDWFQIDASEGSAEQNKSEPGSPALKDQLVRKEKKDQKEKLNPSLGFQLKNLKTEHPFFKERGILPATVKYFGLGFCNKGIMKDRIAIPIHDHAGQLVAYCGRALTDEQIEKEGKYKLPANFVKSAVVYSFANIKLTHLQDKRQPKIDPS